MLKDINVILASSSPRREELLRLICSDFIIKPPDVDETIEIDAQTDLFDIAERIAVKKAKAITSKDSLIIACDTIVISDNKILGKPNSSENAFEMLTCLSGKKHVVVTGVCIFYNGKSFSFSEKTEVEFFALSELEINEYILSGEPFDKAGAYGIQGLGSLFVKAIQGDFFNVVGLPISRLKRELQRFLTIIS